MALPNPRVLPPEMRYASATFNVTPLVETSRTNGGFVQGVEFGDPAWRVQFTSTGLLAKTIVKIRAWWDTLEGGMFSFLAFDPAREFPETYREGFAGMDRAGGGAFDGTATATAIAAREISLADLPENFQMKVGDYLGLIQSGRWSLHRIVEDNSANVSGIASGILVQPPIKTALFTTSATVNFARPLVEIVPDPGSWSGDPANRRTPVSFGGISRVQ